MTAFVKVRLLGVDDESRSLEVRVVDPVEGTIQDQRVIGSEGEVLQIPVGCQLVIEELDE